MINKIPWRGCMKKILSLLCIGLCLFTLSGCNKTIKGNNGLIDKAREEIAISDADTIDLVIAGYSSVGNNNLFWFISGSANQAHTYTPIEFCITGTDEYTFTKTYKPIERTQDIAVLLWNEGYSFCINNASCGYIQIENSSGEIKDIVVESIPFVYYSGEIPIEYSFLDINKNPLP